VLRLETWPCSSGWQAPLSPLWEIKKQFGDEFGRNLLDIKPGRWVGPIRSGFGRHLLFVRERLHGSMPGDKAPSGKFTNAPGAVVQFYFR
jgi:hypothetical protein